MGVDMGLQDADGGILDRFSDMAILLFVLLFFAKRVGGTQQPQIDG